MIFDDEVNIFMLKLTNLSQQKMWKKRDYNLKVKKIQCEKIKLILKNFKIF